MATFAQRLKELREQHNLTQQEIANIVGTTNKAVSTWENGIKIPRQPRLEKLADYFNVTTDYLVGRTEIKNSDEWDSKYNPNNKLQKETKVFEQIKEILGDKACELMILFTQLNEQGKEKAIDTLSDLTAIDKYTIKR